MFRLFFILALILQVGRAHGQNKEIKIIHAAALSFIGDKHVLYGNVICEHEGATLSCDTAFIYKQSNNMLAFGNVLITKGDSIRLTGEKVLYDGKERTAVIENNVKCTDKEMILTTKILIYDLKLNLASYYNGGTLVNKTNTLVSKNGHYSANTREATFHYDVVLTNNQYEMKSDTLRYKLTNQTAYFIGPSIILSKKDYLYCENGWYDTKLEKSAFSKNALLVTEKQKLRGDSLVYDRKSGIGKAFKNVILYDTSGTSFLTGNYIEYRQKEGTALATGKPVYCRIFEKDSMFIAADTMFHIEVDSMYRFLNAYHHVKLFKSDLQAKTDSLTLSTKDSLLSLYKLPIIWMKGSQATAKEIKVDIWENSIKGFRLEGRAFLIQQPDSSNNRFFNQMTGRELIGKVENDTLRKVDILGNSEIIYFPQNKNKSIGLNHTESTDMAIWFLNNSIQRVTLKPLTKGKVTPQAEIKMENAYLKGFDWKEKERPKSRTEIYPN